MCRPKGWGFRAVSVWKQVTKLLEENKGVYECNVVSIPNK